MILVDSGAWFAMTVPTDIQHASATDWIRLNKEPLVTTDYVIDETLTLLRSGRQPYLAVKIGEQLFRGNLAQIYYLTPSDIAEAWHVFQRYSDKDWSFTDCTSKIVMDKLKITTAFTFDHHFKQFPGITVVP